MKRDKWTQQLHDKLAEHETAAPEGLWADIEAAIAQQQPKQGRSRFVALRRWAVAASAAALLLGGSYLWLSQEEEEPLLAYEASMADSANSLAEEVELMEDEEEEEQIESPCHTPTHEKRQTAVHPIVAEEPQHQTAEEPLSKTAEEPLSKTAEEPQRQTALEPQHPNTEVPQRQTAEKPYRMPTEKPVTKTKARQQPSLNLYAMNGFSNQNSSNGVLMSEALAKQHIDTYNQSYFAASRTNTPIYLSGYEEREYHYRPFVIGLTLDYPLSHRLSLSTGVVYTALRSDFTQIMRSQQIQQEQTLHYVGIPLSLNYKLVSYKAFKAYTSAGVKGYWNVATHLETEGVSQELPKDRMQWAFNGSLGVQYDVLPQLGFYVEPGLNWYPDNGSNLRNYFKDKPLDFTLQLGLRYAFRSKK